jgi:hypothetical protein
MFKYSSSVAFLAMLAFGCGAKHINGDDTVGGTGGAGFVIGTGGASGVGGRTSVNTDPNGGLTDITQDQFNQITDAACNGWSQEGENAPALIDFVVDTSRSMDDVSKNTPDGITSKWAITSNALQTAISTLPRMTAVGMLLWPGFLMPVTTNPTVDGGTAMDVSTCVLTSDMIPIAPLAEVGSSQRNALIGALQAAAPAGGTPMADAYNYALEFGMADSKLPGERYMVLITDGQPTIQLGCMGTGDERHPVDYHPVLASIDGALKNLYTKTFVIGSPGSESQSSTGADGRGWLSAAATAGNTANVPCSDSGPNYCHFDMSSVQDFAAGFTAALQNITGQILSCSFKIPDPPAGQIIDPDPNALNVIYKINGSNALGNMKLVAPASDSSCPQGNGWYLDPNDNMRVVLCANTCEMVHKDAGAVLDFRGGCKTIIQIG